MSKTAKVTNIAVEKGRQGITVHESGAISIDGPDAVNLYRLLTIKSGMELEYTTGMRLTSKVPSCFVIAKREHGLKGSKERVYRAFCEAHGFELSDRFLAKEAQLASEKAAVKAGLPVVRNR